MTTIAVAVKDGVAAIGADTMTKYGFAKERAEYVVNHDKIFSVGESYLALAGPAVGRLALEHYFTEALGRVPTLESPQAIFATWLKVHHALRETYFLRVEEDKEDDFESTRMEVVIANAHGIFGVSAHRAVQQFTRFFADGSGHEYAMGAMHAVYDNPVITAREIVETGIRAAAAFDDGTDLPMIVHTVALATE